MPNGLIPRNNTQHFLERKTNNLPTKHVLYIYIFLFSWTRSIGKFSGSRTRKIQPLKSPLNFERIHSNHLEETSSREFVNKMKIEKKLASSPLNFPSRDSKILENDGFYVESNRLLETCEF